MTRTASAPRWASSHSLPRRADAVLAGDRAAEVERGLVEVGLDGLRDRLCARVAAFQHEVRMEVAVARRARTSRSGRRAWPRSARPRGACPAPASAARRCPPSSRRRASRAPSGRPVVPGAGGRPRPRSGTGPCDVAPAAVQAASPRVSSSSAATPGRSDSIMSIAAASRSRPRSWTSSTAWIVNRSISSRVTGDRPAAAIAATASPADSSVGKNARRVDRGPGIGRSRRVASVMIASVPCEPTMRWVSE